MDKHKNADRHKIYPGFREFYGKGLFKADRTLKEEYQCSKCGRKIRINDYEKMKYRDSCIQWFLYILYFYFFIIFARKAADAFLKIVYEIPDFLLRLLSVFFAVVVAGFLFFMLLMVVIWLGRVFFLKWYCAKLQKEEQTHAAAKRRSKRFIHFSASAQPRQALARYERNKNIDKHKNADRHKIYPGFREFCGEKDVLKEEYQCSKCGRKIKLDNYEKMKKRSNLIRWLIVIPLCFSMVIFCDEAADAFSKIVLTYYEVPEFSLQVLSALFGVVVIGIPVIAVAAAVLWLGRVIFLKRYCAKLQKSGTDPCPGEKTE